MSGTKNNLIVAPFAPGIPFTDPNTGLLTKTGLYALLSLQQRTGGAVGIDVATVQQSVTNITTVVGGLTDLMPFALDAPDALPVRQDPLLFDQPVDPPPDMGSSVLLAMALGDPT